MSRTEWLACFQIVLIFSTLLHVDAASVVENMKRRVFDALSKAGFSVKATSMAGESFGEAVKHLSNVPLGIKMMISALFASGVVETDPPEDDPRCKKGGVMCKIKSIFDVKSWFKKT